MPALPDSLQDLKNKRAIWMRQHGQWNTIHYVIGISGLLAAALAAAKELSSLVTAGASVLAGICIALMTFLNPQKKSSNYLRAYKILDGAVLKHDAGLIELKKVFEAFDRAEGIAHGSE